MSNFHKKLQYEIEWLLPCLWHQECCWSDGHIEQFVYLLGEEVVMILTFLNHPHLHLAQLSLIIAHLLILIIIFILFIFLILIIF
jgi:hypothetical protein